jgi:replicative DNA helicase
LSDLRDSGAIEQDAGGVILLHRPEYYEQRENAEQKEAEEIELNVAKSRHSSPGLVRMIWSGSNGRIAQKDEQNAESRTEWAEGDELPF